VEGVPEGGIGVTPVPFRQRLKTVSLSQEARLRMLGYSILSYSGIKLTDKCPGTGNLDICNHGPLM
jgi:hypothetical protein